MEAIISPRNQSETILTGTQQEQENKRNNWDNSTGGKINSKVVTAAIDTNTGDIYYGISGMNNNPTRNVINPQMQAILGSVDGSMTNYPLENCGEFNAINNTLNNRVDISAILHMYEECGYRYNVKQKQFIEKYACL